MLQLLVNLHVYKHVYITTLSFYTHRALAEGELLATNLTRKEVNKLQPWYKSERLRRNRERRRRYGMLLYNKPSYGQFHEEEFYSTL